MNEQEKEMIDWNIQRIEHLLKENESPKYVKVDDEVKGYWHRKGFLDGMKWALHAQDRWNESHSNEIIAKFDGDSQAIMKRLGLEYDQEIVVLITKDGLKFSDIT